MSDSSDLDWSDDEQAVEKRRQELLSGTQSTEKKQNSVFYDTPLADPAFAAQFDPTSPSYHGGKDARPIPLGGQRIPDSFGGGNVQDWRDLPVQNDHIEDITAYGPDYEKAYTLRANLTQFKKYITKAQGYGSIICRIVEEGQNIDKNEADLSQDLSGKIEPFIASLSTIIDYSNKQLLSINKNTYIQLYDIYTNAINDCNKMIKYAQDGNFSKYDVSPDVNTTVPLKSLTVTAYLIEKTMLATLKDLKKAYLASKQ